MKKSSSTETMGLEKKHLSTGSAKQPKKDSGFKIGIDVGGTFTDFMVAGAGMDPRIHKVLSTPADPSGQMARWECADQAEANAWLTRLISSRTMQSEILSKPEPPSASG